jgi:hypothetical protein
MRRALALTAVALAGCTPASPGSPRPRPRPVAAAGPPLLQPAALARPHRRHIRRRRVAPPGRLQIPAIGVDTPLVRLGLDPAGALEVPRRFDVAGWWTGGVRPGERGPAVIAGHVDSYTGPAVFFRLGRLRRGDRVMVERRDGSRLRFTVRSVAHYAKQRFPARRVYGPTRRPELRLITCSGQFDYATGHYLDNTVVFARA